MRRNARSGRALAHEVRILGGQWKRTPLPVLDRPGLRPTPSRVRETLFNWLGQDLSGWRCVDAFAGSGALGFEAASRGAAEVVMLERDPALVHSLQETARRIGAAQVRILRGDALAWMSRAAGAGFDLVCLDPPFDAPDREAALGAAARVVRPGGYVYLEAGTSCPDETLPGLGLQALRYVCAGAVHAHLMQASRAG
ncbi:MAG: 16S rRNA (guanine(966)-N(2))-methyltransferase RsmD [Piscinibacter sp.]|nr:16S rRNA (guanine(966)-N(2))-methyltransferase RsmD [Piscinibacter sp.]